MIAGYRFWIKGITVGGIAQSHAVLENSGAVYPNWVFWTVPIVVLILAGALLTHWVGSHEQPVKEAMIAGSGIALGYGTFAIVGVFILDFSMVGLTDPRPNLIETMVLMGIVYPLTCGALGGAISRSTSTLSTRLGRFRPAE